MSILSGYKKFKRYVLADEGYQLCSQWTSSNTVEMVSGVTLEEALDGKQIKVLTEAQYNALSSAAKSDKSIIYFYY